MRETQFNEEVDALTEAVLVAMEEHFKIKGLHFERANFVRETSADLDQISREAYFFGAETFPDIERSAVERVIPAPFRRPSPLPSAHFPS